MSEPQQDHQPPSSLVLLVGIKEDGSAESHLNAPANLPSLIADLRYSLERGPSRFEGKVVGVFRPEPTPEESADGKPQVSLVPLVPTGNIEEVLAALDKLCIPVELAIRHLHAVISEMMCRSGLELAALLTVAEGTPEEGQERGAPLVGGSLVAAPHLVQDAGRSSEGAEGFKTRHASLVNTMDALRDKVAKQFDLPGPGGEEGPGILTPGSPQFNLLNPQSGSRTKGPTLHRLG